MDIGTVFLPITTDHKILKFIFFYKILMEVLPVYEDIVCLTPPQHYHEISSKIVTDAHIVRHKIHFILFMYFSFVVDVNVVRRRKFSRSSKRKRHRIKYENTNK